MTDSGPHWRSDTSTGGSGAGPTGPRPWGNGTNLKSLKRVWAGNFWCPGGGCYPGSGWQLSSETVFFYAIDGKRLAAYTPQVQYVNGTPQSIYYLLGEQRLYFGSKYVGNANTRLMSGGTAVGHDRLGSNGKYFPYGEERSNLPNDQVKFATYTRDSATGLDYADQRYYTGGLGRFMSPDPYSSSGGQADPGSWNRYTYVTNDPVSFNDPGGLDQCLVGWSTWTPSAAGDPILKTLLFGECGLSASQSIEYMNTYATYMSAQFLDVKGKKLPTLGGKYTTSKQNRVFQTAFQDALNKLKKKPCADLFGEDAAEIFKNATYDLDVVSTLEIPSLFIGAATDAGLQTVTINLGGPFFFPQQTMTLPDGSQATLDWAATMGLSNIDFQAAVLLHELGHLTGKFGPDKDDLDLNKKYTNSVVQNCFR